MGTFLSYVGDVNIPEEKREEFFNRAQQVFYYGGMMGYDAISLNGRKILLLHQPEKEGTGIIKCGFNYFESDFWEPAGVAAPNPQIYSGKVGWSAFNTACCAAYLLQEFYASKYGMVLQDGDIIRGCDKIGWLNYLFDENYTSKRLASPWHVLRLLHSVDFCAKYYDFGLEHLLKKFDFDVCSIDSLFSLLAVFEPSTVDVRPDDEDRRTGDFNTVIGRRTAMLKALRAIANDPVEDTEQKLKKLKSILASKERANEVMQSDDSEDYRVYAQMSNAIPVPISVVLLTLVFEGQDFWNVYNEVQAGDDERAELYFFEKGKEPKPVAKVSTESLFDISGDDRAYWWREDGDVTFSDKMSNWLANIKTRLGELTKREPPFRTGAEFRNFLADVLSEEFLQKHGVYMFRDAFYEVISDWRNRQTQAALIMLRQLTEEVKTPSQASDNVKWVRRYIAVLANPALRKKALGLEIMG